MCMLAERRNVTDVSCLVVCILFSFLKNGEKSAFNMCIYFTFISVSWIVSYTQIRNKSK